MWWDSLGYKGMPERAEYGYIDEILLSTINSTLYLDCLTCIESGLHGLGHWHLTYPERTETLIDEFIRSRADLLKSHARLEEYARAARIGRVL